MERTPQAPTESPRRHVLLRWLASVVAIVFGGRAESEDAVPESRLKKSGESLTTHVRQGEPPVQPLDTMVLFERGDDNNAPNPGTHEVLSLIHQEKGKRSFPWTIYASLETHHEEGDACVLCSRLHKHGPGWSAGLHSEVFNHARAVALGANIEMSNDFAGPEPTQVIGLNIQAVKGPRPMQYGIQVHDGEGHFDKGIGLNGKGKAALDLGGKFDVGLNAHGNSIRLGEGGCIELDDDGRIKVRYNKGRIEFLNGDHCFGHLDVNGADHAI